MSAEHVDLKDRAVGDRYHFGDAAAVPAPLAEQPSAPSAPRTRRSFWLRTSLRVVRNAAVAVVLLTLVPVAMVAVRGDKLMRSYELSDNTRIRMALTERLRFMTLPRNPSITPLDAGRALASLVEPSEKPYDAKHELVVVRRHAPWDSLKISAGMFPSAQPIGMRTTPSFDVIKAAAKGFSPAERAYLQAIAVAPIWRDVSIVARAPAVDINGARFSLPFAPGVTWEQLPILRGRQLSDIGNAALSRAAWFLSNGQRDSAETTLRTIISFGFALMDNGTTLVDQFTA
ncbi:MAG: hypothetical protein H0W68_13570, partial [Gemmatimonadaceae bacterium]|nr:hypothetical protein [Gemmatimonadaceae bacterium]